jgi:glycosyltransferase involved in cell wall biosynthesis
MATTYSIIIATYNAAKYLETALQSVFSQTSADYELILIDGGSKDETVEIIKKHQDRIAYWVSEPDQGIYDAWNKGIEQATGDWVLFIGSDDTLVPDALEAYSDFIKTHHIITGSKATLIGTEVPEESKVGDTSTIASDGEAHVDAVLTNNEAAGREIEYISSKNQMLDLQGSPIRIKGWRWEWPLFLKEMTVCHPGSLHSKALFEKYGKYNIRYKIVGDYEFLLRPKNKLKAAFLDKVTVNMLEGGASESIKAVWEAYQATTETGRAERIPALLNAYLIIGKFKIKHALRAVGINAYLKKV